MNCGFDAEAGDGISLPETLPPSKRFWVSLLDISSYKSPQEDGKKCPCPLRSCGAEERGGQGRFWGLPPLVIRGIRLLITSNHIQG